MIEVVLIEGESSDRARARADIERRFIEGISRPQTPEPSARPTEKRPPAIPEGHAEAAPDRSIEPRLRGSASGAEASTWPLGGEAIGASEPLVQIFEGEAAVERALAAAATKSLIGGARIAVAKTDALGAQSIERILRALAPRTTAMSGAAADERALIVLEVERRLSPQAKKRLAEAGVQLITAKEPTTGDIVQRLVELAERSGLQLDADAAAYVASMSGPDVVSLEGVLAQLRDAMGIDNGQHSRVKLADVEALFEPVRRDPPWVLAAAIEKGDARAALMTLEGLLDSGMHPLQVLASLYTSFRRVAYIACSTERHKELLASMQLPATVKARISKFARRLGRDKALAIVARLAEAELDLKGRSAAEQALILESAVVELCTAVRG